MVKIVTTMAVLAASVTQVAAQKDPDTVRLFTTNSYKGRGAEFPIDRGCQALHGYLYRNAQSLDIPCYEATEYSLPKTVCFLYSDQACQNDLAQVDRPHYNMFSRPSDEYEIRYVGGPVGSLNCMTMLEDDFDEKDDGHSSTKFRSGCLDGESQTSSYFFPGFGR